MRLSLSHLQLIFFTSSCTVLYHTLSPLSPPLLSFSPPLFLSPLPSFFLPLQQKKLGDPAHKAKLLSITSKAVERLEQLKQKDGPSAPSLDDLLNQMPLPPTGDPKLAPGGKASSKYSPRGGPSGPGTARKYIGNRH